MVLGASFDTPEENKAFADAEGFGFRCLSDPDQSVGTRYEVVRDPSDEHAAFALRIAYLIDPEGTVRKSYEVTDVEGFAGRVLDDVQELRKD